MARVPIYEPGLAELVHRNHAMVAFGLPQNLPKESKRRRLSLLPWGRHRVIMGEPT